jgi:hypothetical protein
MESLATDIENLGPTFIKLAQLLSTRADLLPQPYIEALTRLQDKVGPFPFTEVEEIVCNELGVRISKAFSHFESQPVAAASLGQVHRASLRDGRDVVVKVQRPGIREEMTKDLDVLGEIASFMDAHTEAGRKYEFTLLLEEFRKTLLKELDYRLEARNLVTFSDNLRDFDRIVVPQPLDDYTTSRVLTMDYIRGRKITALTPLAKIDLDGYVARRRALPRVHAADSHRRLLPRRPAPGKRLPHGRLAHRHHRPRHGRARQPALSGHALATPARHQQRARRRGGRDNHQDGRAQVGLRRDELPRGRRRPCA